MAAAAVSGAGCVEAAVSTGELAKGRGLYELKCAKCHKLYDPSDYSEEDWRLWIGKMRKKAHLNDETFCLIDGYLDSVRKK